MKTRLSKRVRRQIYEDDEDYDYIPEIESETKKLKTDKEAYNNLIETKIEIIKSEPNIFKILKEPLLINDRALLLQSYEIYKTSEPSTENWLHLRNKVNDMFESAKNNYTHHFQYTKKQHIEMKKQIKSLNKSNINTDLLYKILQLETSVENKQIIYSRYKQLKITQDGDDEKAKLNKWLNWAITIPHNKIKILPFSSNKLTKFLRSVSITLDKELYGMKKVKEQILLFVSSKIQNPHMKKCSMGLIGPPGVGKTHISRSLAKILNFPFQQISLGGISNTNYLKGHQYTYVGSEPGEIIKCLKRMKYKNGIMFFDEFDKISDNTDICSALLHITDPVQNSEYRDNFLSEITIDLSYIWFIYSMNKHPKDTALKDRIHTIEVPSYSKKDKVCIIRDYLFPKSLKNINTPINSIIIPDEISLLLIDKVCNHNDLGIRTLEKAINNIVTKLDFIVKHQNKDGKLPGFNLSFEIGKIVQYPITLTSKLIQKLS